MTDPLNLLPFAVRPHCWYAWCVVDDPTHDLHLSRAEGPRTLDEDGDTTEAAYARAHQVAGLAMVETGLWNLEEGGRKEMLTPDEARELAEALRLAADLAERIDR